jgi:hypothetical protein
MGPTDNSSCVILLLGSNPSADWAANWTHLLHVKIMLKDYCHHSHCSYRMKISQNCLKACSLEELGAEILQDIPLSFSVYESSDFGCTLFGPSCKRRHADPHTNIRFDLF